MVVKKLATLFYFQDKSSVYVYGEKFEFERNALKRNKFSEAFADRNVNFYYFFRFYLYGNKSQPVFTTENNDTRILHSDKWTGFIRL